MKVTVQTTKSSFDLDVAPTTTVKSVMEMVVQKYAVPSWANQCLLFTSEPKAAFPAKKTLSTCGVVDGSVLKFCYAKHLTREEKFDMMVKGQIPYEESSQTVSNMSIDAHPASWYAANGRV
mmetsp:Transcript_100819/g.159452  ORF Transcript_100819/g.159452 Transcript_100819/m.159452 type:complete len:121 (+) Transcript_100819:73-435(+)